MNVTYGVPLQQLYSRAERRETAETLFYIREISVLTIKQWLVFMSTYSTKELTATCCQLRTTLRVFHGV